MQAQARQQWVLNCRPERAGAIAAASPFELVEGPPLFDDTSSEETLGRLGLVGLYRTGQKKDEDTITKDRDKYFQSVPRADIIDANRAKSFIRSIF